MLETPLTLVTGYVALTLGGGSSLRMSSRVVARVCAKGWSDDVAVDCVVAASNLIVGAGPRDCGWPCGDVSCATSTWLVGLAVASSAEAVCVLGCDRSRAVSGNNAEGEVAWCGTATSS